VRIGGDVMDETSLEDKLNELVKEFGEAADPQNRKLLEENNNG
jgi:hypothetical protein